jgi:hypothetical protein
LKAFVSKIILGHNFGSRISEPSTRSARKRARNESQSLESTTRDEEVGYRGEPLIITVENSIELRSDVADDDGGERALVLEELGGQGKRVPVTVVTGPSRSVEAWM